MIKYNDDLYKFGIKCKRLRRIEKISQEKFARRIDMDRSYYASVEIGQRNVSLNNIVKIANGFGVPVSELFSDF